MKLIYCQHEAPTQHNATQVVIGHNSHLEPTTATDLEILPLGSSGKIFTPLRFLTKACRFKTGKLISIKTT